MNATPELLIGFMVFLLVLIVLLVALLIRGARKGPQKARSTISKAVEEPASAGRVGSPMTSSGDTATKGPSEHSPPTPLDAAMVDEKLPGGSSTARSASPAARLSEADAVLLMKVWQDQDGFLLVEAEGHRYRRLFEISDGAIGRRVLETINRLVAFSKGQDTRAVPNVPRATAVAQSSEGEGAAMSGIEDPTDAFFEELRQRQEPSPRVPRITADPVPFRRANPAKQLNITLNLAEEIERLLQVRVNISPEFRQRYIHVTSAPDGALRFDVDGAHYSSVDAIPDDQVKALIQEAISEWEAKR